MVGQEQARGRPGFCFDLRASRGAGGKHGRTHTRLPRAPVPVLARFLSGVRAWEAFVGSVLPNGGAGLRRTAREGPPALSVVVGVGEFECAEAG